MANGSLKGKTQRRQSWGSGDVTADFGDLRDRFSNPRVKVGGEGHVPDEAESEAEEPSEYLDGELVELGVSQEEAYLYSETEPRPSLLMRLFSGRQRRVHQEGEDKEEKREEKIEFTKFKYLNGPAAASATKSFRHNLPKQQYNNPQVESWKSKNFRYMSQHIREQQHRDERGLPIERESTDEEKKARRGYQAAMRQWKGGVRSKSQLIKAYSYGSGARHAEHG